MTAELKEFNPDIKDEIKLTKEKVREMEKELRRRELVETWHKQGKELATQIVSMHAGMVCGGLPENIAWDLIKVMFNNGGN